MADPTRPEPQKIDPTRFKYFWPGPITTTRAYFWPTVNKKPTQSDEIFFDPDEEKKLTNLGFLGEIFQTQTKDGWLDPTSATKNWLNPTRIKKF